ncbi:MAG: site-specific DNA-methyltransferase [Deltaproteobacteria bacterium]|nr:MAG: site-specific DNA-methyltransferase [Deltaproteobacteria bacterium]
MGDYRDRSYLSAIEAAKFLNISVKKLHGLTRNNTIEYKKSASGQMRYDLEDLKKYAEENHIQLDGVDIEIKRLSQLKIDNTIQKFIFGNSMEMKELEDDSVHLMITSPPYFNAKMYTNEPIEGDLGNVHDLNEWFSDISKVWKEVYRVLQPGRKAFINIMNLPIRENKTFRSLNLVGKTIEVMEDIGFIFKRDIIWHKTNGVKAHFGTYPYPGGILLNNMHEFILEFSKPEKRGFKKYGHLTKEQKEKSEIEKDFWLKLKNSDVWLIKPEKSGDNRNHVAPFPYELPFRLIKAYSYISETVLDPFAGSFVTLKAAKDLGRNGIGYEINKEILKDALIEFESE